jgi:hypothetical protein
LPNINAVEAEFVKTQRIETFTARKRRRPDFLFVLAVLVGIGVVATMKVQAMKVAGAELIVTAQVAIKSAR